MISSPKQTYKWFKAIFAFADIYMYICICLVKVLYNNR